MLSHSSREQIVAQHCSLTAVGDVIRSVNGIVMTGTNDFRSELERFKTGDPVVLEIERQGTYQFVSFEME